VPASISVLQQGAQKPTDNPYTIVIVASPYIESPVDSGNFVPDPIVQSEDTFDQCAQYVIDSVFGHLPGQAETFMQQFAQDIRVISIFDAQLATSDATCLVADYDPTDVVGPRQAQFAPLLASYALNGRPIQADVAFAITASPDHTRASAWYTLDDDNSAGVDFLLDGTPRTHRFRNIHPGVVALPASATSLVAMHEFGHAASSWTNGSVSDLYVDSPAALNVKKGRPIPQQFGVLDSAALAADQARDHLGYPAGWNSYHCNLVDPAFPAVMDNFWMASTQPEDCKHDAITLKFLSDRIRAIMSRP
jgi:hypothetical protein